MAKWIGGILLIAYSVAFMRPFLPFLQYQLEKDYYINVLCKNRALPELHCEGKCALMEQLKAAAEENLPDAPLAPEGMNGSDFLGLHFAPEATVYAFLYSLPAYVWEQHPLSPNTPDSLWRPPEFMG